MDQTEQNQQPQNTPPATGNQTPPAAPVADQPKTETPHEALSTVQQPADAQPITLPTETPAQPTQTTAPATPAAASGQQTEVHTAIPSGDQPHKKPLMMMIGVVIVV